MKYTVCIEALKELEAETAALRAELAELRQVLAAVEPIIDWLGYLRDKGEQIGNLNMELVDKARVALARVGGGEEESK